MGSQELLRCYSINKQEPLGEDHINERASLVVSFTIPDAAPLAFKALKDTGSEVSM